MKSSMTLKDKLARREVTIGSWMSLGVPAVAEIMAAAGFEWLVVDLEHTAITVREAEDLVRVVDLMGLAPLVRLSANDPVQIKRVLDGGARGIVVPQVETAGQARAAVEASRYPPEGSRGVGLARAQAYGPGFERYVRRTVDQLVVIAQIEHHRAIENLPEILAVPGIDATIVGPYDLSASVDRAGDFAHPTVQALLGRYEEVSRQAGKAMGYHVVEPDARSVLRKIEAGYSFVAFSTDFLFLGDACREGLAKLQSALEGRSS